MAVESWDVQLEVMVARSRGKRYMCGGVWGRGIVGLQGDGSKAIEEGFDLGCEGGVNSVYLGIEGLMALG